MDLNEIKVTEKKREVLKQMDIDSVESLLQHYPFRYEFNEMLTFHEWKLKERVCFVATIVSSARVSRYGYKKSSTKFQVEYEGNIITVTLFNRPWTSSFTIGKQISIFGKYDGGERVTCISYNFEPINEQLGYIPVYNTRQGITSKEMHKYIVKGLSVCKMQDIIPIQYKEKYKLMNKQEALTHIHTPKDKEALKQSLRYLKYEEFLKFQLQMQARKQRMQTVVGKSKTFDKDKINEFISDLPFQLTQGQQEAVQDILKDLSIEKTMYRLVQGDVGCGKTMVACIGMYASVLAKEQCAFMAPTEILAKQHYQNLSTLFEPYGIKVGMLTSSMKSANKKQVLQDLDNHSIDIVVGTHSLFQEKVVYASLGMVVTDEQHRFGVRQRRQLLEKGEGVDFLLMSATPIPRTLAVSIFKDMDVSTIETLPNGRKTIITKFVNEDSMSSILNDILISIDEGNQMYVVCPAIEANEEYSMRNVDELYKGMQQVLGRKYKLALLHGKMNAVEKEEVMQQFKDHVYDILITTTVVEVGVDIKDANIMVIYDAHRFGMSQLHQLRGRVGRSSKQGYCYLLSASKDEQAKQRLLLVESCHDGFEIAKADLSLRGSGDLLGVRQSGVPSFIVGDLIKDFRILEIARDDATEILQYSLDYPLIESFLQSAQFSEYLD